MLSERKKRSILSSNNKKISGKGQGGPLPALPSPHTTLLVPWAPLLMRLTCLLCLILNWSMATPLVLPSHHTKQESRAIARKPRDAAAVLFGLKFADDTHYKFKSSQASKARLHSSKHTGTKQNLTQNGDSGSFKVKCFGVSGKAIRSLILAPIESAYATSYRSSIINMVLYCSLSEILQVSCWELPHPIPPEF